MITKLQRCYPVGTEIEICSATANSDLTIGQRGKVVGYKGKGFAVEFTGEFTKPDDTHRRTLQTRIIFLLDTQIRDIPSPLP